MKGRVIPALSPAKIVRMPRLLIVNADDFGLSPGVNQGIVEAHVDGIVTSTSLMVSRPGTQDAAELARRHPSLSIGLHFDADALDLGDPEQAAAEFRTQLERFRQLIGRDPSHVDSHHHVHAQGARLRIFSELVAPLRVPLRHDGQVAYLGGFWGRSEAGAPAPERIGRRRLVELIDSDAANGFNELGCHPARLIGDFESSYLAERAIELETLTQPGLRAEIEAGGAELVSYLEWPSRSRAAWP